MRKAKKLIEVAMPVKEISAESVRDKSIRHGHISTLHLWWARRPLPVCRAVVFASVVPDWIRIALSSFGKLLKYYWEKEMTCLVIPISLIKIFRIRLL